MVRAERPHPEILLLTLDRPERRNAVNTETLEQLTAALTEVSLPETRVVVLTGAPPAFCAGADLSGAESEVFHAALGDALRAFAGCGASHCGDRRACARGGNAVGDVL